MAEENLTWEQIKARYPDEWVELINYDWPDEMPWPKSGSVRVHSFKRKEFWRLANAKQPAIEDSAIVFTGSVDRPGVIRNNLMTITVCEK